MLLTILCILLAIVLVALAFMLNGLYSVLRVRIPFVPTTTWAVDWLAANLALPDQAVVYDLGCGDARVLAALAKKFPRTTFIGIEVQWWPYLLARWRARRLPNLSIERVDFWSRSITGATHIFCYLFQPVLLRMKTKFETELRPGTQIISFGFRIPGWTTEHEIPDPRQKTVSRLLFYRR